jgi:hypothetical protein
LRHENLRRKRLLHNLARATSAVDERDPCKIEAKESNKGLIEEYTKGKLQNKFLNRA